MTSVVRLFAGSAMVIPILSAAIGAQVAQGPVLPTPNKSFAGVIGDTPETSRPMFPQRPRAPAGAPNVLLVMTDDVGFGSSSTFGGLIPTPALDRLAATGVRYNNFHTTAMCSPSRAALLTGRNSHNAGTGALSEFAQGFPGYLGEIPKSTATVAEILRQNGYNTAFFGKHHNATASSHSVAGPFDSWPTGLGFEYFLGFMGSQTDQWNPALYRGNSRIESTTTEPVDRILAEDAMQWIRDQKAAAPDKPFFLYLAPGTAHAPLQAPSDWIARFKGKFDRGWDVLRQEIFDRQKANGVVPSSATLTPRPPIVPAWVSLSPERRRIAARLMEVYAAQLAYQDHEFGRIVDQLERMGQLDNTLIIFVEGDNGSSPEGGELGTSDDMGRLVNFLPESDAWLTSQLDQLGGPHSRAHYPRGWAWAMNTPFPQFKRIASHLGGTRNGMVVSWPKGIASRGAVRPQFQHLVDIVPTILDSAKIPAPSVVNGVQQKAMDGRSFVRTFNSATFEQPRVQYFELLGNRALYKDGWLASTIPPEATLEMTSKAARGTIPEPLQWKWALFDLKSDFSQSTDLSAKYPQKLKELQDLWWVEARRNNVLPINAAVDFKRSSAEVAARVPMRRSYTYWGKTSRLERGVAPPILANSFLMTADVTTPSTVSSGVIAAIGDEFGGWSFFLDKGRPTIVEAFSRQPDHVYRLQAPTTISAGRARVQYKLSYLPNSRAVDVAILLDGRTVASSRFPNRVNMAAQGEGFSVGHDGGMSVTNAYQNQGWFDGEIRRLRIEFPDVVRTAAGTRR